MGWIWTGAHQPPAQAARTPSRLYWTLAAVFLVAVLFRGLYISGVAASHETHSLAHFNGDSADYLHLAFNLAAEARGPARHRAADS